MVCQGQIEALQIENLQRLCDEQNLVAMMERNMIKSMSLLERPCQVDK